MRVYEEAVEIVLSRVPQPLRSRVGLDDCLGRVLSKPVRADLDLPPFDKSFMDGYALRSDDLATSTTRLTVEGIQAAGLIDRTLSVPRGGAVQIMTGAALPPGADAVQMVEKTRRLDDSRVEILEPAKKGENIACRASEVRKGDVVLTPGRTIGAAEIGVLASFGFEQVDVWDVPSVAVFATGDELVEVGSVPLPGQIRNSNAPMLASQVQRLGATAQVMKRVRDDPDETVEALRHGVENYDVVLFSGGVSAGEFDLVHKLVADVGLEVLFHKVAIQPGKPLLSAVSEKGMFFGLPGNPVSAFVTFELFVRPALRRWMGSTRPGLARVRSRLLAGVRHKLGRFFFKAAQTTFDGGRYVSSPLETKGSADLVAFSRADSLVMIPADVARLEPGDPVDTLLLADHFDRSE